MVDPNLVIQGSVFRAHRYIAFARDVVGADANTASVLMPFDHLGVFCRSYETSRALERVPLYAIAELGLLPPEGSADDDAGPTMHYVIGLLGTDHVGYASFDLTILRSAVVLEEFVRRHGQPSGGDPPVIVLKRLWVLPFADELLRIDALAEGEIGPNFVALRIELDDAQLSGRQFDLPLASMQSPSIIDWRLSPGSFTVAHALLIGEDGCETLLPANLSTQQFRFMQVARNTAQPLNFRAGRYALGHILRYVTEWFPIGHSLGQILYSLPLAPGEKIKIAVIDWSRTDLASRDERTELEESLVHDAVRDRTLTETVQAVLNEWQRGGSVMGGVAASGTMGAWGGAAALGGAYTTSSGTRELSASTMQRIADAFHQASTGIRELRSTVVVQGAQAEKSGLQTRVVANYNHSHALTMLYYEVLRHYRVVTRLSEEQLALLVDYEPLWHDFNSDKEIVRWRRIIEAALLDEKLRGCLDVVQKLECLTLNFKSRPATGPSDDYEVGAVTMRVKTGASTNGYPRFIRLRGKGNELINLYSVSPAPLPQLQWYLPTSAEPTPGVTTQLFVPSQEDLFTLQPDRRVRWGNVEQIELGFLPNMPGGTPDWDIEHLKISTSQGADYWILFEGKPPGGRVPAGQIAQLPVTPFTPPIKSPQDLLSDEERCCIARLKDHLTQNALHYNRAIWLAEDPGARARRFAALPFSGNIGLLDVIENRPVDVIGSYVVFPVNPTMERFVLRAFGFAEMPARRTDDFVEQLLSLPTRGVFGEAKLGHCNASEVLDETRFWDWQRSPIPDNPPEITGVSGESRYQPPQGVQPTPFPGSLVNIVNPQGLPDPTGMTGALGLFASLGAFRDMSAAKEVGALLQKLSDNATLLGMNAQKVQNTRDMAQIVRNTPELSPAQKSNLIYDLIAGQVKQPQGGQSAAQTQGQTQGQGQSQTQQQAQGQAQSQNQSEQQTQGQAQDQGQGQQQEQAHVQTQAQIQAHGQQNPPRSQAKPVRTSAPAEGPFVVAFVLQDFEQFGGVRMVWGSIRELPVPGVPENPVEYLEAQAPAAGQVRWQTKRLTRDGTSELIVQLADAASTACTGVVKYKRKGAVTTIIVRPRTTTIEVSSKDRRAAEADAAFKIANQAGLEFPVRVLLVKVQNETGTTLSLHGEIEHEETYKYTFVGLLPGLKFSGDVEE